MSALWKESYKIGDELIDSQHKQLFEKTEQLLETVRNDDVTAKKTECINTIQFLKKYSIEHFAAEEKFQESINYQYLNAHKEIHERFIKSILESEKKMLDSDFFTSTVKEFTGFLTAWLTYHVAGADQKIKTGEVITKARTAKEDRYIDLFMHSIQNLLVTMFDQDSDEISIAAYEVDENAVSVRITIVGDCEGEAILSFPQKTVLNFVSSLTQMEFVVIDEMAYSVLSEITNIVCGNVATLISNRGLACDINPPQLVEDTCELNVDELFCFSTNQGQIAVTLNIAS